MAGYAPGLAPIAARPPTPPKESTAKASANDGYSTASTDHVLIHTPDESPSSSAEYFKDSTGKIQKKVGFTLLGTQYHRFSVSGQDSDSDGQIRQLPRSRDCKSSKSILKACTDKAGDLLSNGLLAFDNTNFPAMLRSTAQHLASSSRASRLDAYSTLLACLSAYDEVPEGQGLAEKVAEITGYIRRDVSARNQGDETLDIQLAIQALKLIIIFLCTPSIAVMFQEDFCSFVLERSIASIEDEASPKILVSHYMQLLEKQKFAPKLMTNDRVNRLISVLDTVTARVKGNRVIAYRLMIYQRLLGQAKTLMASRVGSWIDHLIAGMLSTMKDIRSRAIAFGTDASLLLGTTGSVSQACLDLFNRASADGTKVIDFVSSRLIEMASSKEDGFHVPQIWSTVIMLLRSRRCQLQNWEHLKGWLAVIQRCFNSSDSQTKSQAITAWNRLVFAVILNTSTSVSMAKMLRQPIVSQLQPKPTDKNHKMVKQTARSSYCVLLYYALRPAASHTQLDQYWDLYVHQILPSSFVANKSDVDYACDILSALFSGNGKPRLWDENRISNGPVNVEELPCLDPKWIRLRAARILQVFDKLFDIADWQLSKDEDAPIVLAWRSFASALGTAGGKEIKVSMDAMNAVTAVLNEIKLLLERSNSRLAKERTASPMHIASEADQFETFEKIRIITNEAAAKVGCIPFLERRLIRTSQDSFEAAETPSSRSSRDSGSLNSPVAHLLSLFLRNVQYVPIAISYSNALRTVLNISLHSTMSRRTQLGVLRNFGRLITLDGIHQKEASNIFWRLLAERTSSALKHPQQNQAHEDSAQFPGHDFRDAVKILELGVLLHAHCNACTWQDLLARIIEVLRHDIGEDAIGLVVIEPLAGIISKSDESCDDFILTAAASMLESIHWPCSRQSIEHVQHRLWGVTYTAPKVTSQDPFDKLYSVVAVLLSSSYASLHRLPVATVVRFISSTINIIAICPPDLTSTVLFRTQRGLALWIEDAKALLSLAPSSPHRTLNSEVNKLWSMVISSIERFVVFDTRSLFSMQELLIAGFRSRHKSIVNKTIAMWNSTFGGEDDLEYPEGLREILQKLKLVAELRLPNFPDMTVGERTSSPLHFVDSQDEEEMNLEPAVTLTRTPAPAAPLARIADSIKHVPLSPHVRQTAASQGSPSPAPRRVKTTPKARLRHDDSQIQFAAIESSPLQPESAKPQYLTDRQKEVKERQGREAAAMFPEIRSSPRSASWPAGHDLPKLTFQSTQYSAPNSAIDKETSPTYLPDALMSDFLGSSPTPGSKKSNDRRSDDPPSSPLLMSSHFQMDEVADAPPVHEGHTAVEAVDVTERTPVDRLTDESLPTKNGFSSNAETMEPLLFGGSGLIRDQDDSPKSQGLRVPAALHSKCESDIHAEAPSASSLDQLSTDNKKNPDTGVINSFCNAGSSQFSVEDDQVTAQLITEMERASSQQSAKPDVDITKKRKCYADSPNMNKKTKRTPTASDPQATAAIPLGETVADCVMIDVREVDCSRTVPAEQIKREMSASPSIFTSTQAVEESVVVKTAPDEAFGHSGANLQSGPDQEMPMRTNKAVGRPRGLRNSQVKHGETGQEQASVLPQSRRMSERLSASTTRSPHSSPVSSQDSTKGGQWLALGKTPRKGMFRWLRRSSAESEGVEPQADPTPGASAPANAGSSEEIRKRTETQDRHLSELSPADHRPERSSRMGEEDREVVALQRDAEAQTEASDAIGSQGDTPTVQGILQKFHSMLDSIKRVTFGPEEERAMVGILFESVKEVHEAGRRHNSM